MPGRHDIYVFETEPGVYLTRPAVAMVVRGKKIRVRNLTGKSIHLNFPAVVAPDTPLVVEGKKGTIDTGPKADGIYDYTVDVKLTAKVKARAPGNSWPKIIVDP